ncbi:MAG: chitobiase/beta-hexosaminidase C-terminal domain-containing protein [Patescibacteria group bacterium]|nr:chitobiase/beta-hexosaminidase C-terminal domain-containing protein [Patescibacteria group bacterium]
MSSARLQQRQEWLDYLDALPYFDNIPIYLEEKKDIANEIQRRLGTAIPVAGVNGICVVLLTVKLRPDTDSDVAPVVKYIHCAHVIENPVTNISATGTNKPREEVTEQIISFTHGKFQPQSGRATFQLSNFELLIDDGTGKPSEDSFFECEADLGVQLSQVATPTIANNAGTYTLACATPGAAIFYTLDGTKPGTSKTLYTAPITPGAGLTLRARGYLSGFLASTIVNQNT